MSITENDLCEIDDTVVTCSDETLNVPMEAADVLILDSDTESEHETENMENKSVLTQLQEWATTYQVSNTSLGGILKISVHTTQNFLKIQEHFSKPKNNMIY